jgi:hypothetical protein
MQTCNRIYSKIYWRLNMFRAAYRSSSGASNCILEPKHVALNVSLTVKLDMFDWKKNLHFVWQRLNIDLINKLHFYTGRNKIWTVLHFLVKCCKYMQNARYTVSRCVFLLSHTPGLDRLFVVSRSHTIRHTRTPGWTPLRRVIISSQRPLPTQNATNTKDELPRPQCNSNPRPHQPSSCRPTS